MAEKLQRRIPKWDVVAELHDDNVGHDSTLPEKVDDTCMDLTEVDTTKNMTVLLSMNVDGSEINQSANQSAEEINNKIIHSDEIREKTQYSEQLDLEGGCKDGFKKQALEPASQDGTKAEYVDNQDKPQKVARDMSPCHEESYHRTCNMPPADERRRPDRRRTRSRSRSLSYDSRRSWTRSWSRSKSPSCVSKQGSERWTDKGRMRGMTSVCRAFTSGMCRRGNECRYLHESGGRRQNDRHHDSGLTDGRGSRLERERSTYESKESLTDTHSRERSSRRHDEREPIEKCYDFTIGKCFRGEACRYIHNEASGERFHDRRGVGGRQEYRRLSDVPCKYFLQGRCIHGERCKFYHQVDPLNASLPRSIDRNQQTPHSNSRGDTQPIDKQNFTNISLFVSHPEPNHQQTTTPKSFELSATNPVTTTSIPGQNTEGQTQFAPILLQPQNFTQNSSIQPFAPPLSLKPQMQQSHHHQNGKNQFPAFHNSANSANYHSQSLDPRLQVQQNLPLLLSHQQVLPQNMQSQLQSHLVLLPQPSSSTFLHPADEKNCELTTTTTNIPIQIGQLPDSLEAKPSLNSDNSISHKLVTTEQAAKITDLSASLAQFFGTTARNSSVGTEDEANPSQEIHVNDNIKQADASSSKEVKPIEAQNGNAECMKDDDSRQIKAKEIKIFKCSLVEFVKDIMKPIWKEGQLSKEAYKTIVKKVVDKVCGSLQGPNLPQTQEKIDLYLLNSKPKLSKLVQAYVEKFVNS